LATVVARYPYLPVSRGPPSWAGHARTLQTDDGATGLNFFTPIADALAFLSLEPR
jgi:hypothetical protein